MELLELYNKARLLDYNSFAELVSGEIEIKPKKKAVDKTTRALKFAAKVKNYTIYSNVILNEFIDYWTESGENDKKMRFEKEKSFDISRRLKRWTRYSRKPIANTKKVNNDW